MIWPHAGWGRGPFVAADAGLSVLRPRSAAEVSGSALRLVASGRGVLRPLLGDDAQRCGLLADHIRWEGVWLLMRGDEALGFVALKRGWRGPYAPGLSAFTRSFGLAGGWWRWVVFWALEWRDWRHACYLYSLKVVPEWRRQGLAARLLEVAMQDARDAGLGTMVLEVAESNVAARALYERMGFRIERVWQPGRFARALGLARWCRMRARL